MRLPPKRYIAFSAMFAVSAVYHLIGALGIAFVVVPQWRHAFWVVVDGGLALAMLDPRPWLITPIAAITIWSFYSHGWLAFLEWRETGHFDWPSLAVVIVLPIMLSQLICDSRKPRLLFRT